MRLTQGLMPEHSHPARTTRSRMILLVGTDAEAKNRLVHLFEGEGFQTLETADVEAATKLMEDVAVDLVVLDERHSSGRAYSFCRRLAVEGGGTGHSLVRERGCH